MNEALRAKDLLAYYNDELGFIRKMGEEFGRRHPEVAARLQLEGDRTSADPHVERLLEGFALLAARIHQKLDNQFPELTEAFFHILYPHYLRPIPSMTVVEFDLAESQSAVTSGIRLDPGTRLYSEPVEERECEFRTGYPVTVLPLSVTKAAIGRPTGSRTGDTAAVIQIELRAKGAAKLPQIPLEKLRFFLKGEDATTFALYELLFNSASRVVLECGSQSMTLGRSALRPVGFEKNEALLPYDARSFLGYGLLQEYFAFPWKFLFFDVAADGFRVTHKDATTFTISIYLEPFERPERLADLEREVTADTFRLGCTPAVNLYSRLSEPITLTHAIPEYWLNPDQHNQLTTEIYSVDRVVAKAALGSETRTFEPFYSVRHGEPAKGAFWYAARRPTLRKGFRQKDRGTDVFLSFVDLQFRPAAPAGEVVHAEITCTNRDLASGLRKLVYGAWGAFNTDAAAGLRVRGLIAPTDTLRPPMAGARQWRLISHLALNHLSLTEGLDPLREMLSLYEFTAQAAGPLSVRSQLQGLVSLSGRRVMERIASDVGVVFCQGLALDLEVDEGPFAGAGCYPFLCVLERFFALYASMNSFSQLTVKSRQRREAFRRWNPRAGDQTLL